MHTLQQPTAPPGKGSGPEMSQNDISPDTKRPHAGGGVLRRHAYEALKGMILSSTFHPGERLSEVRLSQLIGVVSVARSS